MQITFMIYLISFFIFLFCLYILSKEDYIFVWKNVTLENIFDLAFINLPISIFAARLAFVLLHPQWKYFEPLIFLAIPYYPGLSLSGGIIGSMIFLFLITKRKKMPSGRVFDVFSLAFLLTLSLSFLLFQIIQFFSTKHIVFINIGLILAYFIAFIVFSYRFLRDIAKEGSTTLGILLLYSFLSLLVAGIMNFPKNILVLLREQILLVLLFFAVSTIILMRTKKSQWRKKTK